MKRTRSFLVVLWVVLGASASAWGMAFINGSSVTDPNFHTTAPALTGTPGDGGWQWVGAWGSFTGTPIGAHHFLTANHVGGYAGDTFVFQGANYLAVAGFKDPASDLQIWEVRQAFSTWAPLHRTPWEAGTMTVFGRGLIRGAEVRTAVATAGVPVNTLAGWYWGNHDGRLRWGQNTLAAFTTDTGFGPQLVAYFDQTGGDNECALATYDSGGPVFMKEGTSWKLAGVAGKVEAGFQLTSTGAAFNAFIFDKRGLYQSGTQVTGTGAKPAAFLATRVSTQVGWIDTTLATPLVASATVTLSNLDQVFNGTPRSATVATVPAGLSVRITYNGLPDAPTNAGSYTARAVASGSSGGANHFGEATGTLVVAPAGQTITFDALAPRTFGDAPFAPGATASSGLAVSYTSGNTAVATVSGSLVTIVGVGSAVITANQAGNANYAAASPVSQTLTVNPASAADDVPLLTGGQLALVAGLLAAFGFLCLRGPAPSRRQS